MLLIVELSGLGRDCGGHFIAIDYLASYRCLNKEDADACQASKAPEVFVVKTTHLHYLQAGYYSVALVLHNNKIQPDKTAIAIRNYF